MCTDKNIASVSVSSYSLVYLLRCQGNGSKRKKFMSIIVWAATLQKQAEDRPNLAPKENNSEADMFPNYCIQGYKYIVHLESRRKMRYI